MATAIAVPGFSLPASFIGKPTPAQPYAPGKTRSLDSDSILVQRCVTGDVTAWEDLVRVHTRRIYGICYRFTGSDAEAQDLTQDVFLRIFKTVKSFRVEDGSFGTWTAKVARNLLIDYYRRTRQERATDSIEDQLTAVEMRQSPGSQPMARPDAMVIGREKEEIVQAALKKLSPELRETVILRDLQELEYREIAVILSIPEGTVKSRLNRGRAELARILRKQKAAL
jgi:RNA polymerase sigma-70 factor, ECF subfamily